MKPFRTAMIAASLLAAASCSAVHPASPHATATAPESTAAPFTGVYEGNSASSFGLVRSFGAAASVRPSVVLSYSGWWVPFSTALAGEEHAYGATPLIQMNPQGIKLAALTAGKYDAYLRSYAASVKAFGHPVILGFGHEMNGTWYSWGKGRTSPAVFVAAWRHVVSVFRSAGALNVTWLWAVNSTNATRGSLRAWWPGGSWVGYVGIDGYYYQASDTFSSVFGRTVTQVREFTKAPVLISETAVGTTPDREAQIRGLFAGVKADRLLGLVWFDENQAKPPYHQRWRLESDPAALRAYAAAAAGLAR
jgi:ABC-type amino acid transport substrate-binding protein